MASRIKVGVLGATGMVGQNYIRLLRNHPWFEITFVAASPNSAGKTYEQAVAGRWLMSEDIPREVKGLVVADASQVEKAVGSCSVVFSAVDMDKEAVKVMEAAYAAQGFAVVSNNSAFRSATDVPMIIPEINPEHLEVIQSQRTERGFAKGFITVKSNCTIQSYVLPVHALMRAGYPIKRMFVATLQALSGAGYPGLSGLDVVDNIIPFVGSGEEDKAESEPLKLFGSVQNGKIVNAVEPRIAAHCNRVPVTYGHTACVSLEFEGKKPSLDEIITIWTNFKALPQELKLPSAPHPPLVYRTEPNRPQPVKDRNAGNGMTVTVGRLRPCPVLDVRFVGLSHNTVRGAAGGCILTAELLKAKGWIE
jgi:aspartate-semialdehyde dehydrogenase